VQRVFFGNLRDVETQNLNDRLLTYVLFKIVFVGAVVKPDAKELLIWTSWFSILGFLKIFTMLCRDRFEYLNTFFPNMHAAVHLQILCLLGCILTADLAWSFTCARVFYEAGISVLLLLNFECFTIFLDTVQTLVKYVIHLLDLSRPGGVCEKRGQHIYYTEFVTGMKRTQSTLPNTKQQSNTTNQYPQTQRNKTTNTSHSHLVKQSLLFGNVLTLSFT